MFYRQMMYKLRKKNNVKTKESLELLQVNIYPVTVTDKNKSRKKKKKESLNKQKNLNDKNARLHFYRKAMCNFDTTDYVWHLTYDDSNRPSDINKANIDFKSLITKVNRYRKRKGLKNAKYMAVIEGGEDTNKRIHFHMIIDGDIHRDELENFWTKGKSNIDRIQFNDDGIKDLVQYMTKDPKGKKRWKQSKGNLVEPVPYINDNKFTGRQMKKMITNQPSREELEKMYPGYILTDFKIKSNSENGEVYMNIVMRRYVKNIKKSRK